MNYTPEQRKQLYIEAAERNASIRIEQLKGRKGWNVPELDESDMLQLEIDKVKSRLQKNSDLLQRFWRGGAEIYSLKDGVFDYLKEGLDVDGSYILMDDNSLGQFHALVDYRYLQKLKSLTPNNELSPLEKVKQVIETRKRDGINSYDEAIDLVEKETGKRPFKNYNSFSTVRDRWEDYL